jgi:protein-L-isoaspartate(D-aspartate) O-methyltransferase
MDSLEAYSGNRRFTQQRNHRLIIANSNFTDCDKPMEYVDFINKLHTRSNRDYVQRVTEHDKAESAAIAKQWGYDYWDGDRRYGYGGYHYDGRWRVVAKDMIAHYGLNAGDKILDVGCGKAFLLYEFTQVVPGLSVAGIDISGYALAEAKEEVKSHLTEGNAIDLPYPDNSFDFVYSITTLHNLHINDLDRALKEIDRVSRSDKSHITIEAYRNEKEKANLLYWQLTCESFFTPEEWEWVFKQAGYKGDYGCIYFE